MEDKSDIIGSENEIKLYSLLVDQLLKYQRIIWQIPTALVLGDFLVIEKFKHDPYVLLGLILYNFGLLYVFYRMIKNQSYLIDATRKAESILVTNYKDFLPHFKRPKISGPILFIRILIFLELFFLGYIIILFHKIYCGCP
jgi:hypothetical protein